MNGDVDEFNARQIGKMMVDSMTGNTAAQFTYKRGDHAITLQSRRSSLGVDGERVQLQVDQDLLSQRLIQRYCRQKGVIPVRVV